MKNEIKKINDAKKELNKLSKSELIAKIIIIREQRTSEMMQKRELEQGVNELHEELSQSLSDFAKLEKTNYKLEQENRKLEVLEVLKTENKNLRLDKDLYKSLSASSELEIAELREEKKHAKLFIASSLEVNDKQREEIAELIAEKSRLLDSESRALEQFAKAESQRRELALRNEQGVKDFQELSEMIADIQASLLKIKP